MKRLIAWLCVCLLLCTLFACRKTEDDDSETVPTESGAVGVTLPFSALEPFNPFTTKNRMNRDLSTLVFDSLFRVDATFTAQPVLAASIRMEGVRVEVTLQPDVHFSNGDLLTARDVSYSFQFAKESEFYAPRLSNVFRCTVEDDTAVFTLIEPNVDCALCLDFPIVKFSTASNDLPVGCGRYLLQTPDSAPVLKRNENAFSFDPALPQTIALLDVSESENVPYLLQIGDLTCLTCDPDVEEVGKLSAGTMYVPMNNLVFLGFNAADALLTDAALRRAISAAVDKVALTDAIYGADAAAATTPFNPSWSKLPEAQQAQPVSAAALLDEAGYLLPDASAAVRSKGETSLRLTMIVNEENAHRVALAKELKKSLSALGMEIVLDVLPYESYQSRLQSGEFSLYLGEVKLTTDMNLSRFFDADGTLRYGVGESTTVKDAYTDYLAGAIDLPTFIQVFAENPPFLPLCYRNLLMFYTRALNYGGAVSETDPFGNIVTWAMK